MIERIIEASAKNKFIVFLLVIFLSAWGLWALKNTPLDAIPDLSDVQVIVYTPWMGRNPTIIEDQVTYPIVTTMVSAPRVKSVRGFSDFGYSYVYIVFEDATDIYWARSRVLEYLNQATSRLPRGVTPTLGPDASGVGWVFQYALIDESMKYDLAQLRSLQDWYLRYQIGSVEGVAEVASVGGFVRQYQVNLDPNKLAAYRLPVKSVVDAIRMSNNDVGGRSVELSGAEYMVRGRGYIRSIKDIEMVTVGGDRGTPVLVRDIASVTLGPDMRRGIAELDGKGEVVGGIVVMRHGENALSLIDRVKQKIKEIEPALPPGVKIVSTYDRSDLILRSIATLKEKLIEESLIVSLVIIIFYSTCAARWLRSLLCRSPLFCPLSRSIISVSRPTSCPSAGSPSPSAPWSMPPSSWWKTRTSDSNSGRKPVVREIALRFSSMQRRRSEGRFFSLC